MAARGLIHLFRAVNPGLLKAKDRGRPGEGSELNQPKEFGRNNALDFLAGAEILNEEEPMETEEVPKKKTNNKRADSESDSEGWVDLDSGSEIEIQTDSEEEDDEVEEELIGEDGEEIDDEEDMEELDEEEVDDEEEEEDEEQEKPAKKAKNVRFSKVEKKKAKQLEKKVTAEAILEKARLVSDSRILTDDDFKKIRAHQIKKQLTSANPNFKNSKMTNDDQKLLDDVKERIGKASEGDGLPRLNAITQFHKKVRRQTKAERLEQIKEGRTDRDEYKKKKKNGPHVGRTNANLAKHKNFQMVRQKVRGKNRQRSFRDQQQSLRNYLLKQAGRKPGNM